MEDRRRLINGGRDLIQRGKFQNIYELPTRPLLHSLSITTINQIPDEFLQENISNYGFDYIWLMGVWQTGKLGRELDQRFVEGFKGVLNDFDTDDLIGSPFSINKYKISDEIGGEKSLELFRNRLFSFKSIYSQSPIRLILDFVPNHTSIDCNWVKKYPNFYLSTEEKYHFSSDYKKENTNEYLAFGSNGVEIYRDTLQLNYWDEKLRNKMFKIIAKIAEKCDGIRCNLSSLCLNDVIDHNFGSHLRSKGYQKPEIEFWSSIIRSIKMKYPAFLFIGESYSHHWELLECGFDFIYDKKLYDQLAFGSISSLRSYLSSLPTRFLSHSCHYTENHDEKRAITIFGYEKSKAAAIIAYSLPGLRLQHLGQHQSFSSFLFVQLRRKKEEIPNEEMERFYFKLQGIISQRVFQDGEWEYLPAYGTDSSHRLFAWRWRFLDDRRLVVVNYSDEWSSGKIVLSNADTDDPLNESICVTDLLTGTNYLRNISSLRNEGLFVILPPWNSHIFSY